MSVAGAAPGGGEAGLASTQDYRDLRLSLELALGQGAVFIAKLHQQSRDDQMTNSYHLVIDGRRAFIAAHNQVLHRLRLLPAGMIAVELAWTAGVLDGRLGDQVLPRIEAPALTAGFCFVGLRAGTATLRELGIAPAPSSGIAAPADAGKLVLGAGATPSAPGFVVLDDGATLASERRFTDVALTCEIAVDSTASLLVKLHQQDQCDGRTNSYHLLSKPDGCYVARHHFVLARVSVPRDGFHRLRFLRAGSRLQLFLDEVLLANIEDTHLHDGYCVLSVQDGSARLRGVDVCRVGSGRDRAGRSGSGSAPSRAGRGGSGSAPSCA